MAKFKLIPLEEAQKQTALAGKRGEVIAEYLGYLERLPEGQAAKLKATEGETIEAVRRRLGAAARLAGIDLVVKRMDDEIYFWSKPPEQGRRRRRRSRTAKT